jgi:hypothetical protein
MLSCIRACTRTFWRRQRPKMARGFAVRQVSNEGWEYEPVDVSGHGVEEERIRGYRLKKVGNPIQARACVHTCKAGTNGNRHGHKHRRESYTLLHVWLRMHSLRF